MRLLRKHPRLLDNQNWSLKYAKNQLTKVSSFLNYKCLDIFFIMHGHHILEYLSYFNLMLQGYQFLFCNSSTKPNILGRYYFVHSLPQDLYFCYDKTMPPFLLYDHFLLIKIKSCLGYNMSLDDACHFEKRLFHASFATVCFHLFCFLFISLCIQLLVHSYTMSVPIWFNLILR